MVETLRLQMVSINAGLDKRNHKLFMSTTGRRMKMERSLLPSSTTLVIFPNQLLEHWFQQIIQRWEFSRYTANDHTNYNNNHRGLVYIDGIGDIVDARMPLTSTNFNQPATLPWELSQYHIVISCFSRCEVEYNRLADSAHLTQHDVVSPEESLTTKDKGGRKSLHTSKKGLTTSQKRLRPGSPTAVQGSDSAQTWWLVRK
jgi:hypothetical protein